MAQAEEGEINEAEITDEEAEATEGEEEHEGLELEAEETEEENEMEENEEGVEEDEEGVEEEEEGGGEEIEGPVGGTDKPPEEFEKPTKEPDKEKLPSKGPTTEQPPKSEALQGKIDDATMKELLQVEKEAKEDANAIYELKIRIEELLKKEKMTEAEEKELEEKNLQLKDLMLSFDQKTQKIQEIIANTNILEAMPVRQPQAKHEEDVLPRVILCGLQDDYVPKLIVCNQKLKGTGGKSHQCLSGCPGPSPPPCVPSATKKPSFSRPEKSEELDIIKSKLENDITAKNRLLEELQMKLQNLQTEIHMVATENAQLNDKIRRIQQDHARKQQESCQPKKMCPSMLAMRLQEYSKYTRKLERQVADMEADLDKVHREICDAMKARDKKISPCRKR